MSGLLLGLTSILLGALHGADPDHMAEITDFVSQEPQPGRVVGFALKFGGGHTLTVLVAGLVMQYIKGTIPDLVSTWFEVVSGLLLVALGVWAVRRTWRRIRGTIQHQSQHGRGHSHKSAISPGNVSSLDARVLTYGPILTGVATGLAGSAAVMLIGPIASAATLSATVSYILLYGAGVIGFMTVYGLVVARAMRLTDGSPKWTLFSRTMIAGLSMAVGGVWIYRATLALRFLF